MPGLVSTVLNCMAGDHERSTGSWHAEWETMAAIVQLTAGSVRQAVAVMKDLEVDSKQMLINLELSHGLIYSENISIGLTPHIGKVKAEELLAKFCMQSTQQKIQLKELLKSSPDIMQYLSQDKLDCLFDPKNSTGLCQEFIDRVLKSVE